jgi:hypothetical protein
VDDAAAVKATGKAWREWFAILEERGARSLPHAHIARMLHEDYGVSGWWSQSVTVAYEKEIGRRETGRRGERDYTASTSRTLRGGLDEVFDRWLALVRRVDALDGVPLVADPTVSRTAKWRYWRAGLSDGSKVTVTVSAKPSGESCTLGLEHGKLAGRPEADRWRAFWKGYLTEL